MLKYWSISLLGNSNLVMVVSGVTLELPFLTCSHKRHVGNLSKWARVVYSLFSLLFDHFSNEDLFYMHVYAVAEICAHIFLLYICFYHVSQDLRFLLV